MVRLPSTRARNCDHCGDSITLVRRPSSRTRNAEPGAGTPGPADFTSTKLVPGANPRTMSSGRFGPVRVAEYPPPCRCSRPVIEDHLAHRQWRRAERGVQRPAATVRQHSAVYKMDEPRKLPDPSVGADVPEIRAESIRLSGRLVDAATPRWLVRRVLAAIGREDCIHHGFQAWCCCLPVEIPLGGAPQSWRARGRLPLAARIPLSTKKPRHDAAWESWRVIPRIR